MPTRVLLAILSLVATPAAAQQPTPLFAPQSAPAAPEDQPSPAPAAPPADTGPSRVFCGQTVSYHLVDPDSAAPVGQPFIGIWSDAAWTPQLCAALIVENVAADGTATISYAFGPLGSGSQKGGGVLHGTGIVQNGELKFQNNDGSQYAFKPFYADLGGHWTTPKGENYDAIFKRTP
jgi:hypothetical protein